MAKKLKGDEIATVRKSLKKARFSTDGVLDSVSAKISS